MKPKLVYTKKCDACGSIKWQKYNEYMNWDGGYNIILFECQNCKRLQSAREIDLEVIK